MLRKITNEVNFYWISVDINEPDWIISGVGIRWLESILFREPVDGSEAGRGRFVPPCSILVEVDLVVGAELLAIIQVLVLPDLSGTGPSLRFGRSHRLVLHLRRGYGARSPPSPLGAMADEARPQVVHAKRIVMAFPGDKCRDFRSLTAIASGDGGALQPAVIHSPLF